MLAVVTEVLGHGAASVWSQELQRCSVGSCGSHDGGVLQAIILAQNLEELSHRGALLSNSHVDAVEVRGLVRCGVHGLLVQDGVDGNGSLASLTITNDELSLTTANWNQAVHGLEACSHWLMHTLARNDARRLELHTATGLCGDWTLAIDRSTQGIHHSAQQLLANWHVHDGASALHAVTLHDGTVIAKDHDTNVVSLQVQCHALESTGKLNHFSCLHTLEPIDTSNTIAHGQHTANLLHICLVLEVGNALTEDLSELSWAHLGSRSNR
mmetsp:Transcript_74314/g.131420  ORF Transcript_74314/g.131420 Transcript_74314/m.131420 type:complete len:269 (+) Transcript_74314:978-1784(+)